MTTITEQLEGLLPADGNLATKDERIIAEAVRVLRFADCEISDLREVLADSYIVASGKRIHASDCATSCAPAYTPGPCDCTLEEDWLADFPSTWRAHEKPGSYRILTGFCLAAFALGIAATLIVGAVL